MTALASAHDGLELLRTHGASPWLVRHHELVVEAATLVCDALEQDVGVSFDRRAVLLGASVHDAGKIVHPEEMSVGGNRHDVAGKELLVKSGVPTTIARFCVTHAAWDGAALYDDAARRRLALASW